MKTIRLLAAVLLAASAMPAFALTSTIDGIIWTYTVSNGKVSIGGGTSSSTAVSRYTIGALVIPSSIGGYPVTSIGGYAFYKCSGLTSVTIPDSVTSIGDYAFFDCSGLTSVAIPDSVTSIGSYAFSRCSGLTSVAIPDGVKYIGSRAFYGCTNLVSLDYPTSIGIGGTTFAGHPYIQEVVFPDGITQFEVSDCYNLRTLVLPKSIHTYTNRGIDGCTNLNKIVFYCNPYKIEEFGNGHCFLPGLSRLLLYPNEIWYSNDVADLWERALRNIGYGGRRVCFCGEWPNISVLQDSWEEKSLYEVSITITNVVSHHVIQSVLSHSVTPPLDVGIVNIISEVHAGAAVAISSEWATQYGQAFTAKFGSDFTKAVTALTGKRDGAGNAMQVWQDFVAGTDPTDENDVFTASITFDADGKPQIAYSPKFENEAEAAKRKYTTYGKVKLTDKDWTEVPEGEEAAYNFFKVTVEMK